MPDATASQPSKTVHPQAAHPKANAKQSGRIVPVLLSGGSGTRLWPLSRATFPKQLLSLVEAERSLLQATAERVKDRDRFAPPILVCNAEHRFVIAEQLRQSGIEGGQLLLEPVGRNTAPAAALAALKASESDPKALLLLLPADHAIGAETRFLDILEQARPAAEAGRLVTFGITPDRPETGYGYIRAGAPLEKDGPARAVEAFVEKPDGATAERYLASGDYLWNSGMFLMSAEALLGELERHAPEVLEAARAALEAASRDLDFLRPDAQAFAKAPDLSLDYAVMERTDRAAVVPADIGWTDVGAWSALWELGEKDEAGNVSRGDIVSLDTKNSYLRSEELLLATLGVEDLVVVATDDSVLVAKRGRDQDVKALVEGLRRAKRREASDHPTVHRPWGSYRSLKRGERFQVKQIVVKPGGILSLQKHFHRAEHWVVVSGTARVVCGERELLLRENESTFIPLGTVHRLENPGKIPLVLIEVQSGGYLEEDDIVRLEDAYARSGDR